MTEQPTRPAGAEPAGAEPAGAEPVGAAPAGAAPGDSGGGPAHRHPAARDYLPAMGRHWLLALYDPITRLLGVRALHQRLVDQADLRAGQRVLEIGCGTGNLAMLILRQHPQTTVTGLDPDPRVLARAGRKARRAGLPIRFDRGYADELPYPDASVDRVFSALMLHHLDAAQRPAALREVARVLVPGGSVHVVDVGGTAEHTHQPLHRWAHRGRRRHPADGTDIPALLRAAGLHDVRETGHGNTPVGRFTYFRGTR